MSWKEWMCMAEVAAVQYKALWFCKPQLKINSKYKINSHQSIFYKYFNLFPLFHKSKYATKKPSWSKALHCKGFFKISCKFIPKFLTPYTDVHRKFKNTESKCTSRSNKIKSSHKISPPLSGISQNLNWRKAGNKSRSVGVCTVHNNVCKRVSLHDIQVISHLLTCHPYRPRIWSNFDHFWQGVFI